MSVIQKASAMPEMHPSRLTTAKEIQVGIPGGFSTPSPIVPKLPRVEESKEVPLSYTPLNISYKYGNQDHIQRGYLIALVEYASVKGSGAVSLLDQQQPQQQHQVEGYQGLRIGQFSL
ncbi:hypothetical protein HAX54_053461 [Datura stramonium]|uniref:Uncharacterized protein n=1 Tax=Datura stramonium TaxID=4076 RepID=A0ABS8T2P5_DATST|nr:hypothetical protein [Datura stramonium]